MLIHFKKHTFGNECSFAANNSILAAKADSLKTTQFPCTNTISLQTTELRQRMLIRCRQHTFSSEHEFAIDNTISAANTSSPLTTQFWQRTLIPCRQRTFDSEHEFAVDNTILATNTSSLLIA